MRLLVGILALALSSALCAEEYIGSDKPTFNVNLSLTKYEEHPNLLKVPKDFLKQAKSMRGEKLKACSNLPKHFDWREKGLTPIRDQRNCGSCWAFSTTAAFADGLFLRGIKGWEDVSEQFRVGHDKTRGNSGCNGGWNHFDHYVSVGSILEAACPYVARTQTCPPGWVADKKVMKWGYVSDDNEIPSPDEIKCAMWTYGPLSVAVAVAGQFQNYRSGIYNESASGSINHAVNLVGWDDELQYWIMRNSWGSSWGENGYMRIKWGSRKIAYGADWVSPDGTELNGGVTPPPPPPPPPGPVDPCENPVGFWAKLVCWFKHIF